jgi:hypothetical protein
MVVGYLVTIRCDLLDLCTPDTLPYISSHFAIYLAASFGEQHIHACTFFAQVRTSVQRRSREEADTT